MVVAIEVALAVSGGIEVHAVDSGQVSRNSKEYYRSYAFLHNWSKNFAEMFYPH